MLELRDVHTYYDESHILRDMGFRVERGEVVTLVGRNGVGKTTTLKTIMGIVRAKRGTITFDGKNIERFASDRIARAGIAFVPEERGIFGSLTVAENLTLPPIVGDGGWSLAKIYDLFPILKERGKAPGTTLSGGEQQMLAMARVLRTGARMILLDEPTEGLAPVIVDAIGETIRAIKASGMTVLLVEQNLRFATGVADRHYLVDHGHVVRELSNAEAIADEASLLEHLGV
jgi:branched-chain amino acid transport system ATP-binding protein